MPPAEARLVSLTSTGPDVPVVELQVSSPEGCPADSLRGRLGAGVRHVVDVFESGVPIDVAVGDVWVSGRVVL